MDTREALRLFVAAPLVLALSFFLVYTAFHPSAVSVQQVRAQSEMALFEAMLKASADIKEAAFAEHDQCVSEAQRSYLKRWEEACKRNGLGPDCLLEKDGPSLNENLKQQKNQCKDRFDMRMRSAPVPHGLGLGLATP